jgi:two-component system, LytTR family, response regulator
MTIRTLIVDDEPPARCRIRQLLKSHPDVEVIGECGDGETAVEVILSERLDLIFLDVQMPEMDGFEVVNRVTVERMPVTVFVTAHDRYAIRAFDVHALDYLLKPFDKARFGEALGRARAQLVGNLNREALRAIVATLGRTVTEYQYSARVPVTHQGRTIFVSSLEIDWIEANGNYVRLHTRTGQYDVRETIASVEQKLHPRDFLRIHRSTIVNVRSIKEIHRWFRGHHVVVLNGGKELRMSRYQRDVARRLGIAEP